MNKDISTFQLKKEIKWFAIVLFATLISGCIEYVDNPPKGEPKLVVYSFITPSDTIKVSVRKSIPLYQAPQPAFWDDYYPPIPDATVTIRNTASSQLVTIPYNNTKKMYILLPSEYSLEVGEEYELRVNADGLLPVAARTIIPNGYPILDGSIDINSFQGQWSMQTQVSGALIDEPGVENFYSIFVSVWAGYASDELNEVYYQSTMRELLSDAGKDGQRVIFRSTLWVEQWNYMDVFLLSVDENYYRFHKALQFGSGFDDPFSEPRPLYTNIEGGLGIFASYVSITYSFTNSVSPL